MSKAVMLSIRPKWCDKIASGEKTIEVRKTKPKLETPFKCYIYCTLQGCNEFFQVDLGGDVAKWNRGKWWDRKGKVIGEFTCDRIYEIQKRGIPENFDYCYLSLNEWGNDDIETEIKSVSASCVSKEELNTYGAKAPVLYCWHIADLRIYDVPRELSEFWRSCPEYSELSTNCLVCENVCGDSDETDCNTDGRIYLRRAPQSWCYVEAMEGK